MKYVTSRVVQPKVVKPFEFTSAMTSFSQSLEEMHAAYNEVVAAEGRVLEMEECLNDCHNALESIKAYGVNRTNMGVLNSSGKLDTALGLEDLQLEALESLSEASKKLLQAKYVAALEDLQNENTKTFLQKVKEWIARIWTWLKSWFVSDAKSIELVNNCKLDGELDAEAVITAVNATKAKEIEKELTDLSDTVINGETGKQELNRFFDAPDGSTSLKDYERDAIGKLGWDANAARDLQKFLKEQIYTRAKFKEVMKNTVETKIQTTVRDMETARYGESKLTGVINSVKMSMKIGAQQSKLLSLYKRKYNELVMTLVALDKHCKPSA